MSRLRCLSGPFPGLRVYSFKTAVRHPQGPAGYLFQESGIAPIRSLENILAYPGASNHTVRLLSLINQAV